LIEAIPVVCFATRKKCILPYWLPTRNRRYSGNTWFHVAQGPSAASPIRAKSRKPGVYDPGPDGLLRWRCTPPHASILPGPELAQKTMSMMVIARIFQNRP